MPSPQSLQDSLAEHRGLSDKLEADTVRYAISFTDTLKENEIKSLIDLMVAAFAKHGVETTMHMPEGEQPFITCYATPAALAAEAEHLDYLKETKAGSRVEFEVADAENFRGWSGYTSGSFWLPCERVQLTLSLLEISTMEGKDLERFVKHLPQKRQEAAMALQNSSLLHALKLAEVVDVVTPLHSEEARKAIWHSAKWSVLAPVQMIYVYFGSHVAFYFAWMNFFTTSLVFPGVIGVAMYVHRVYYGFTVDNHPYLPLYSLFMVFWALFFCQLWKRKSAELACSWGTYGEARRDSVRPEFTGDLRVSPVSGEQERYYPSYKRKGTYILSVVVTGAFLSVAFGVMILSLNLQGYIKDNGEWTERIFFFPWLAQWSDEGRIFDPALNTNLIPVTLALPPTSFPNPL